MSAVDAEVTESMESRELDPSITSLVTENSVQTRDKVIKVLLHGRSCAACEIRHNTTSQLGTIILLRGQGILDVASNSLSEVNLLTKTNNKPLESNQAIFRYLSCLSEERNDDLSDARCELFVEHATNLDQDDLEEPTQTILKVTGPSCTHH